MRKVKGLMIAMLATAGAAGCMSIDEAPLEPVGEAQLRFADGRPAGTATLLKDPRGLRLTVNVLSMAPGPRGFHLHTTGKCEAPGFASAGGHLKPDNRRRGTQAIGGAHLGDLPNLQITADGTGRATETVQGGAGALASIFDSDGTAIIVHADADDYRTDPTGNAGDRVACGVVNRTG